VRQGVNPRIRPAMGVPVDECCTLQLQMPMQCAGLSRAAATADVTQRLWSIYHSSPVMRSIMMDFLLSEMPLPETAEVGPVDAVPLPILLVLLAGLIRCRTVAPAVDVLRCQADLGTIVGQGNSLWPSCGTIQGRYQPRRARR
jgi:hypothetical protein